MSLCSPKSTVRYPATTAMTTSTVPHDFLLGPGRPKILKAILDFERNKLPEYKGHYAAILDNVFTKDECDTLVRAAEARSNGAWEPAMINIGGGEQILMTDTRDCGRIIWDDVDLVERIWSRIEDSVPEIARLKDMPLVTGKWPVLRGETWKMTRLNERMRFLKYGPGQYFGRERLFSLSIFNPPFFDRIFRVLMTGFQHTMTEATRLRTAGRCHSTPFISISTRRARATGLKAERRRSTRTTWNARSTSSRRWGGCSFSNTGICCTQAQRYRAASS